MLGYSRNRNNIKESRERTLAKLEARQKATLEYASAIRQHIEVVKTMSSRNQAVTLSTLPKAEQQSFGFFGTNKPAAAPFNKASNKVVSRGGWAIVEDDSGDSGDEQVAKRETEKKLVDLGYFRVKLLSQDYSVWSPSLHTFNRLRGRAPPRAFSMPPLTTEQNTAEKIKEKNELLFKRPKSERPTTLNDSDDEIDDDDNDTDEEGGSGSLRTKSTSLGKFIIGTPCSPEFQKTLEDYANSEKRRSTKY